MDTRQLEVYITAVQYMNFTEASKRLNMVPSAVSHNISMLENELQTKLFTRDKNKLSLTAEGKSFLYDAIRITTIARNAVVRAQTLEEGDNGSLKVGFVFPEFVQRFLTELKAFSTKYPTVDVSFNQYDSIAVSQMLSKKELDVAFGRQDMFANNQHVIWRSLYRDPFMVVMHRDHSLASVQSITIPMLKHETIVMMNRNANPGMFDMIQHLFLSHSLVPMIHDQSNHHITTMMLAAMQKGVVIIPYQNIRYMRLPDELVYRQLSDPIAFHEIGIAWNDNNVSQLVRRFLEEFF